MKNQEILQTIHRELQDIKDEVYYMAEDLRDNYLQKEAPTQAHYSNAKRLLQTFESTIGKLQRLMVETEGNGSR